MIAPTIPENAIKMRGGRFLRGYHFDRYKTGRHDFCFHSPTLNSLVKSNYPKSTYSAWVDGQQIGSRYQTPTRAMAACIDKATVK